MTAGGELLSRRVVNDPRTFLALLAGVDGESKLALEATYGWEWLAHLPQRLATGWHAAIRWARRR